MSTLDIRTFIPHTGRAVLLDQVVAAESDALTAEVTVRHDSLYLEDGVVGAWVGLEYMAQAAAAHAGLRARDAGGAVPKGVLLGTRRYECDHPSFPLGCSLRVTARRAAPEDAALSTYECRLTGDGIHASATITIYHGARIDTLLAGDRE
jgi:predicted hotdog family 3-hydroxylacyl-ACP dehydratase